MSIAVISRVLNSPEPKGAARLVLLVYADRCDDTGGRCFPSIADTARRAAMSRTQAQTHTRALIQAGFLEVIANANGGAPGTTRHYRVCLERLGAPTGPESRRETPATGPEKHTGTGPEKRNATGPESRAQTTTPIVPERLGVVVEGASGAFGDGLAPTPQTPGGVDAELWAAIAARPAFRRAPAALEALAGEVCAAHAAGESPELLTRRLRVLLEPERQHLTRLPFDPAAPHAVKKQPTKSHSRNAQAQTRGFDFGGREKDYS